MDLDMLQKQMETTLIRSPFNNLEIVGLTWILIKLTDMSCVVEFDMQFSNEVLEDF